LKKDKFEFKKLTLFILFFCFFINAKPQQIISDNWGFNTGLGISFGTHIKKVSLFFRTYLVSKNLQWNNDLQLNYYFKNIGPKKSHPEIQFSSCLLVGYGKKKIPETFFINKISNQTYFQNAFAYSYNVYFNTINTSQQTGTVGFQFNSISVNFENDLLAKASIDRFRTGSIQIAFQKQNYRLAITHQMWTGKLGKPVYDSLYPFPNGYLDTINSVYPFISHGILYACGDFVERNYFQQFRGAVGVDADQLRHVVQNKFMHDELYLPKKWRSHNNHHFPMIDTNGEFYLFKPSQKIRKPKLFTQFYLNPEAI
jgi:hypothetical protein